MSKISHRLFATLLAFVFLPGAAPAPELLTPTATPTATPAARCSEPEYRRLDFWEGDWDAYEAGKPDKPIARTRVERILGGCALLETYEQNDGLVGQSFTIYDATRKLWHQSWVTNRGALLTIEGAFDADALKLQGILRAPRLRDRRIRAIWRAQEDGVRETAETSPDGGTTWKPLFDLVFRAHKNPTP